VPRAERSGRNAGRREMRFGDVWTRTPTIEPSAKHRETCSRPAAAPNGRVSFRAVSWHVRRAAGYLGVSRAIY